MLGQIDRWTEEWMNGRVDGQMDGWERITRSNIKKKSEIC
jgi:hypothetical protein